MIMGIIGMVCGVLSLIINYFLHRCYEKIIATTQDAVKSAASAAHALHKDYPNDDRVETIISELDSILPRTSDETL